MKRINTIGEIQETFPPDAEFTETQNGFNVLFEDKTFCFYYNHKQRMNVVILGKDQEKFWSGEELKAFYKLYRKQAEATKAPAQVKDLDPAIAFCLGHIDNKISIMSKDNNRNNMVTIEVLRELKKFFLEYEK